MPRNYICLKGRHSKPSSEMSSHKNVDDVFLSVIPQMFVVRVVDNDTFNEVFRKNPFNFQNYKITLRGLVRNNELITTELK